MQALLVAIALLVVFAVQVTAQDFNSSPYNFKNSPYNGPSLVLWGRSWRGMGAI